MVKAVIFDMDGVLLDSEKLHMQTWKNIFKDRFNYNIKDKDFKPFFGTMDIYTLKGLLKLAKVKGNIKEIREEKKKRYAEECLSKAKLYPGAKILLNKLRKKYKVALVSSEWRANIKKVLKKFDLKFSVILGKEDVKKHKPNPQPYILACKKLKIKPSEAIVVEDSVAGVESAKRAKCKCIAVSTSYKKKELAKADLVVNDIRDISL